MVVASGWWWRVVGGEWLWQVAGGGEWLVASGWWRVAPLVSFSLFVCVCVGRWGEGGRAGYRGTTG